MTFQWNTATEHEIVEHCLRSNPNREIISELDGGLSIIKISKDAVVKCGFGVNRLEAENQQHAYDILNPTIIRVPRVYHFFKSELKGCLVMEYIEGQPLSSFTDPDAYLEPIAKVLELFEDVQRFRPGPLHEGVAFGHLWLDYDPIAPATLSDIEEYYNNRQLRKSNVRIRLASYPQVFCHLDLHARNILVLEDGSLCLVDWNSAGFYPRLFERVALKINIQREDDWNTKLLGLLGELDDDEKIQAQLLEKAYNLGQRYICRTRKFKPQLLPGMSLPPPRISGKSKPPNLHAQK